MMTEGKDAKDIDKDTKGRKDMEVTFKKARDMIKGTEDVKDVNDNKDTKRGKDMSNRCKIMKST